MLKMEIRASEGGADAELFAAEFAGAVSTYSGSSVETAGKTYILSGL